MNLGWLSLLRGARASLLDVIRAEIDAIGKDLTTSAKRLGTALLLLFFALGVALFALGALAFAAIAALALVVPPWAAALIVCGILLLISSLLLTLGMRGLRDLESPAETVKRRVNNHVDWWRFRVRRSLGFDSEAEAYRAHDRDPWRGPPVKGCLKGGAASAGASPPTYPKTTPSSDWPRLAVQRRD